MRKWSRIMTVILVIAIFGGLTLLLLHSREPVYQGTRLTVWCEQYHTNHWTGRNQELDKQAETAIRNIGTNALPSLLKMIGAKESPVRIKLLARVPKPWLTRFHVSGVSEYKHELAQLRRHGAHGLIALGAAAKPAIPALIAQLQDKEPDVRYVAVFTLRCLGPTAKDALPALITCINDSEFTVQDDAVIGLGTLQQEPERVVPILIDFLQKHSKDTILCPDAMGALSTFRAQANPAVPLLLRLLQDEQANIRSAATNALRQIDPQEAAKAGVK
jgi:HEAT repeats/HEAT repeat